MPSSRNGVVTLMSPAASRSRAVIRSISQDSISSADAAAGRRPTGASGELVFRFVRRAFQAARISNSPCRYRSRQAARRVLPLEVFGTVPALTRMTAWTSNSCRMAIAVRIA